MSRYVEHKHGLTIGSDNVFFVIDQQSEEGEPELVLPEGVKSFREGYRAIVRVRGYSFTQINSVNVRLRTPAQQLIWREKTLKWDQERVVGGVVMTLPYERQYLELSKSVDRWLTTKVGPRYESWDTYTRGRRQEGCIFFKRRRDALEFVRFVSQMLKGIALRD